MLEKGKLPDPVDMPASELPTRSGKAHGVHKAGVMNGTEQAYEALLKARQQAGDIAWYAFEAITLKLADDTRFTPDFFVMRGDLTFEAHECKGRWEDDALVKIKVAAKLFPIRFLAAMKLSKQAGGGWKVTEF